MAELPKYQQTGRIFSDVPQLDFANVRESFKRSQSIANSLDKMSQFAGKFAEAQVERQAEQFSIDNPITIEQLKNAQESGISPDDLIKASGGGTIWEDTVRKFQGEQLRAQLEVYGQKALADIQSEVQLGALTDINEIKTKYQSAISGMEAPLAQINPESALRFKQSMASTANSFYKEATKKLENDYRINQQVLSQANLETTIQVAKSTIATINDPQILNETRNVLYKRVYEQAKEAGGGGEFAQAQANSFLKAFDEEKINYFVDFAFSDEMAINPITKTKDSLYAFQKLSSGNLGEKSQVWQSLNFEDKAKIFNTFRQRDNDLRAFEKEKDLQQYEQDTVNSNQYIIDYYKSNKTDKSKLKLLEEISSRNPKVFSAKDLNDLRNEKDKEDENAQYSDAITSLKLTILTDKSMSWDDVVKIGEARGISKLNLNKYIFGFFSRPSEQNYTKELIQSSSVPSPSNVTKFIETKNMNDLDSQVNKRILELEEKNQNLPIEKRIPLPSKTEILREIKANQKSSPQAKNLDDVLKEANDFISSRSIKGLSFDKNSGLKDVQLLSQINSQTNAKYDLDKETRDRLIRYLQMIDNSKKQGM